MSAEGRRDLWLAISAAVVVMSALSSLVRVFADLDWLTPSLAALVLATAIAAGARLLGLGRTGAALASLVGLTVFTYVVHLPPGPLIPGSEQLGQARDLLDLGLRQFVEEPAPVATLGGLSLIVTTGVWFVAHVTHELVVRWRMAAVGLAPSAVLWTVPLAVPMPAGRTWPQVVPFALGAAALLLADASLSGGDGAPSKGFTSAGRQRSAVALGAALAALSVAAAAAVPASLPGYQAAPWLDLDQGNDPRGYQPIVDVGDRLQLPEPRDVLRVQSDRRVYLRLAALDTFDGTTWRLGPADSPTFTPSPSALYDVSQELPPEVPIGERAILDIDVEVLDLENIYVPVPYQPARLSGDIDDMVYSVEGGFVATAALSDNEIRGRLVTGVRPGLEYQVTSNLPTPSYEDLQQVTYSPAEVARYLQLPRQYQDLRQVALDVYERAGATTPVEAAFALQDWFTGPDSEFSYSLDVDALRGDAALTDFVLETKVGYCEYFATAMAVMLRATGVPARVSVGFLGGRITLPADPSVGRDRTTYTVSTTDAHAWVEVLFPGHGWVRFEPTPRSDGATMQPRPEDLDPLSTEREVAIADAQAAAAEEAASSDEPTPNPTDSELPRTLQDDETIPDAGPGGASRTPTGALALVLVVGLAVAVLLMARWRRVGTPRSSDPRERVLASQRQVLHHARAWGVGRSRWETVRELRDRWTAQGRANAEVVGPWALLVEQAAFGVTVTARDADHAEALATQLLADLAASVSVRDRALAPMRDPLSTAGTVARRTVRAVIGARSDEPT